MNRRPTTGTSSHEESTVADPLRSSSFYIQDAVKRRKPITKRRRKQPDNDCFSSNLANFQWIIVGIMAFASSFYLMDYLRTSMSQSTDISRSILKRNKKSNQSGSSNDHPRLITTNFGWNHPNPATGLKFGRTLFSTELHSNGVTRHEWYDSDTSYWLSGDSGGFTYVFVDVETCFEQIWPNYGGGLASNSDTRNGRSPISSSGGIRKLIRDQACPYIQHVLDKSPLFQPIQSLSKARQFRARLVIFDCGYFGPTEPCLSREANSAYMDERVSLVSLSATTKQHWKNYDIGLPAPAITTSYLDERQQSVITLAQCNDTDTVAEFTRERPYLLSFMGNFRHPVRQVLRTLNDNRTVLIQPRLHHQDSLFIYNNSSNKSENTLQTDYIAMLQQSQFAAVPRGDYLYTYRLLEVLSAGAIPVIFADDWVLPFHSSVIDWTEISLIIPQAHADQVLEYMSNISLSSRCRMRQRGYQSYLKYLSTPLGTARGIIESLDNLRRQRETYI